MATIANTSSAAKMSSATNRTFATVELLEMILLEVSINARGGSTLCLKRLGSLILLPQQVNMQTLLVSCQRVNKTFKATIDGYEKLQQALWFQADPDPKNKKVIYPKSDPVDLRNPLLVKFQERIGITKFKCVWGPVRITTAGGWSILQTGANAPPIQDQIPGTVEHVFVTIRDFAAARDRQNGSWRKMLLLQGCEPTFAVRRADSVKSSEGPFEGTDVIDRTAC
ncbi:hypothetical protein Slin15195_G041500 [Septoria linicola]|uniref:Uncharacterized protein n=1 Tax=Septoria linicola TaxID=215465 RepID=A0A9Q9AU98_9PEZI|nr:hypothetical protein Slin14017_G045020 [Septoria linicola]USW50831.1 hypothetical protein Slin15195_G041500 [Septoria linicola]